MTFKVLSKIAVFGALGLTYVIPCGASLEEPLDGKYTYRFRQCEGTLNPTNCVMSEEGIEIKKRDSNSFFLYAKTRSGSIYHSCTYSAVAHWKEDRLVAGDKKFCEVTVSFKDGEATLRSEGDGCWEFCSAQASLSASNLKRKIHNNRSIGTTASERK